MVDRRLMSAIVVAVITAIGCGGSTPRDASATTEEAIVTDVPAPPLGAAQTGSPIQLAQATPEAPTGGGAAGVQGIVTFEGTPPARKKIQMAADPVCQQQYAESVYSEEVIVNDNGTLRNVFVYAKEGVSGSYPTPSEPVVLDQAGCLYTPHVTGIYVNQALQIVNSDETLHNINAKASVNRPFNIAQPIKGMKMSKKFSKPEVMVRFKCNVHPWMSAYVGVLAHPFFSVSGEDGAFAISGLPDGTYLMEAWHERYGTQTQSITVTDGQAPPIEFAFSAE